jgi:hypothetical protein
MKRFCLAAIVLPALAAVAVPAAAQQADYLDDRSKADQLVKSLYNAVSRQEYARAWDYFGDDKPAKDFDSFVKGYEDTERVTVMTGPVSEEGAAGSTFFEVPVAIQATAKDGSERMFGGCYSARLTGPALQDPPFRPMYLVKGTLKPGDGALSDLLPKSCGDAPAPSPQDIALAKAKKTFAAAYEGICQNLDPTYSMGGWEPQAYEIKFKYSYETESDPERSVYLFQFPCGSGAYNTIEVYYTVDAYGETRPVTFAEPELDIRYENDDFEGKLESMTIIGYRSTDQLINSGYDAEKKTIYSYSKWRGIGDASSVGTWLFRGGAFTLVKYEADPTYDGEENLQTVLDFETGP